MYINPILAGVFGTVAVEIIILIVITIFRGDK